MPIIATDSQNYDNIASAIRTKNGLTTEYKPSEMAQAILDIPSASVTGTLSISANGTFNVANYASVDVNVAEPVYMDKYHSATDLKTFTDTSATSVQYGAFAYTPSLNTVSFPEVKTIDSYAFAYCYKLSNISFPKCTTIGTYAFHYCSSLTFAIDSSHFPLLSGTLAGYAFRGCQYLTGVSLPNVASLGAQTFSGCSRIKYVNLPNITSVGAGTFSYLTTCSEYSLPKLTYIAASTFYSNWALSAITLPAATTISSYAFRYCSKLMSLYLTGSSIPTLNAAAFSNMPMSVSVGNVYGSIYVPSSMLTSYKAATNWSTYKNRIVAIS